jgi:hypothetical protein
MPQFLELAPVISSMARHRNVHLRGAVIRSGVSQEVRRPRIRPQSRKPPACKACLVKGVVLVLLAIKLYMRTASQWARRAALIFIVLPSHGTLIWTQGPGLDILTTSQPLREI